MDKTKKKGFADSAITAIITLVIGMGIAIMLLVFIGSMGGTVFNLVEEDIEAIGNNVVVSEAFTADNTTTRYLTYTPIQASTLKVTNGSGNVLYTSGNFTLDEDSGSILLTTLYSGAGVNGSTLYANYTWGSVEIRNGVRESMVSGFSALEQVGSYLPIIVLAVVITLVMALILSLGNIGGIRNSGGGSAL